MAGREFRIARIPNGDAPNIISYGTVAAQSFKKGAVLISNYPTNNLVLVAGANPTTLIVGVALQNAFSNPGNQLPYTNILAAGSPIGGRPNDCSVAMADKSTVFSGRMVNGGTDPVTPTAAFIGLQYGLIQTADGTWAINGANTATVAVQIIDIEPQTYAAAPTILYFKFLSSATAGALGDVNN
jgi:hypothetical protein